MKLPNTKLRWQALLLIGLLGQAPLVWATSTKTVCLSCGESQVDAHTPQMLANSVHPATSSTPTSLKKSVSRISGGMLHLRQQVIQQNKTSKAQ